MTDNCVTNKYNDNNRKGKTFKVTEFYKSKLLLAGFLQRDRFNYCPCSYGFKNQSSGFRCC